MFDEVSLQLAKRAGDALVARAWRIATAESCTGGGVAMLLTAIAGSSEWVERGFVTYTNEAKHEMLDVRLQTLEKFGAVSEQTAQEMAQGAKAHSHADVTVSITGIAGPSGGTDEKPVGTVCFGYHIPGRDIITETCHFTGDRAMIRLTTIQYVLNRTVQLMENMA